MLAVLPGVLAGLCWSLHDLVVQSFAAWPGRFRPAALGMLTGSACFFKALSLGPFSFVGPVTAGYPALILLLEFSTGSLPLACNGRRSRRGWPWWC